MSANVPSNVLTSASKYIVEGGRYINHQGIPKTGFGDAFSNSSLDAEWTSRFSGAGNSVTETTQLNLILTVAGNAAVDRVPYRHTGVHIWHFTHCGTDGISLFGWMRATVGGNYAGVEFNKNAGVYRIGVNDNAGPGGWTTVGQAGCWLRVEHDGGALRALYSLQSAATAIKDLVWVAFGAVLTSANVIPGVRQVTIQAGNSGAPVAGTSTVEWYQEAA